MKILQVIPVFYPAFTFGGPVRVVYNISKELVRRGHEVTVYTTNAFDHIRNFHPKHREYKLHGFKICYFTNIFRPDGLYISPNMFFALKKDIANFDVIHLHSWRQFQEILTYYFATIHRIPYVLQAHGALPKFTAKRRLKWAYDVLFGYRILRDASKVIALSQIEAQQYERMGLNKDKIEIIPNGIDLSQYSNLPPTGFFKKKYSIAEDEKIVLYLGRIHESKGLKLLANAFRIITKTLDRVRLVIVGPDDGYASSFIELVSNLRLTDRILITGFVNEKEKLAALTDSEVFVTPCFSGFPVTFLEACVTGTPIVTTTKADELDWIHNKVGLVVEYSSQKLAESIMFLLTNNDVNRKMGQYAKHLVVSEFAVDRIVTRIERLYKEMVK